jgi:hypothetical protein
MRDRYFMLDYHLTSLIIEDILPDGNVEVERSQINLMLNHFMRQSHNKTGFSTNAKP